MAFTPQDEVFLVEMLQAKQELAYTTLYTTYSSALRHVLTELVKDSDKVDDLLQDTFIKVWLRIHQYDPTQGRLYTWLLAITRHVALDELRDRKIQTKAVAYIRERTNEYAYQAMQDGLVEGSLLALLSPAHRQILELTYTQGKTQSEIAQLLGLPLGTVKTRGRAALGVLKDLLQGDIKQYQLG